MANKHPFKRTSTSESSKLHQSSGLAVDRRTFLAGGISLWSLTAPAEPTTFRPWRQARFNSYPFTLGVASGEPSPHGMVLWTRLAPDPLNGGGMPPEAVQVEWRVATDETMSQEVQHGTAIASPALGHSVHVETTGLQPAHWYWYQFRVGSELSPVGRTRTAPASRDDVDQFNFAFASCQHYETGFYSAFRHMASEDLQLVVHLGDYIYEGAGRDNRIRKHTGNELDTLVDYRNRYALYKSDPDLQAAHAAFPWLVTWDDHEVDNNYAGELSENNDPVNQFLQRRTRAYQAYYEHLPLRQFSMPRGPNMQLYRETAFGNLINFFMLDTRQYRSNQPCGDGEKPRCPETQDPAATLLGSEQEQWLYTGLDRSSWQWNVLGQQVMMAAVDRAPGPDEIYRMDKWNGYEQQRNRVIDYLRKTRPSNPVILTGDIHSNWVTDLKTDFRDANSTTVATEFAGTSISSGGNGEDTPPLAEKVQSENPFVKFLNAQRGYVRCAVTPQIWKTDFRVLEYVNKPDGPISTRASFVVEDGEPGAKQA